MDPKEIRDYAQLSPESIKHLSDHELLAQWYLTMYKFHLYCDLRDQCKKDHEFSALVQPLMLLNAERDLILHEIERRDMVLEKRTDVHLMDFNVN